MRFNLTTIVLMLVMLGCAVRPGAAQPLRALVIEHADARTGRIGAALSLQQAGFQTESVNLSANFDPGNASVLFIGSFATEIPGYTEWIGFNLPQVASFVRQGGVVVQMAQARAVEQTPPFLIDSRSAGRTANNSSVVRITQPAHPLLTWMPRSIVDGELRLLVPENAGIPAAFNAFEQPSRVGVLASLDPCGDEPVILEAQIGEGRVVATAMSLDKVYTVSGQSSGTLQFRQASLAWFLALREYASDAAAGDLPAVVLDGPCPNPEPLPFVEGSATIVVMPDTQLYAQSYPALFNAQAQWVLDNLADRNIIGVLHEGDITNRNTPVQWDNARTALGRLVGVVPLVLAPGNHDYGNNGSADIRTTLMNSYFPVSEVANLPSFGGTYEPGRIENSYHLFEANGQKYVAIALEWSPRDPVVAWAGQVLAQHPDRVGIIVTHAYMYSDNTRYDWQTFGSSQRWSPYAYGTASDPLGVNDGEDIWQAIGRRHKNLGLVFSGHVLNDGAGRLSSRGDHGNTVHQMLANYQFLANGGNGWFRLIEILPDNKTIQVKTYSPTLNQYMVGPQQQFILELDVILD